MPKWVWTDSLCCEWGVEFIHLQQVQCCNTRIRVSGHLLYMQVLFTLGVHFRSLPEHKSSCWRRKERFHHVSWFHSALKAPMKLTLTWFRTHRDSRRRTGGRRPVCTSLLSDRRQGCRRSWWSWGHRVQDSSSRVCSCTCDRGSDEWRPPSAADQTTIELLLTSRHDRPAAAGSDRGWATRPRRRTSRRRRNGWGTLGEPAAWRIKKKKRHTRETATLSPCELISV